MSTFGRAHFKLHIDIYSHSHKIPHASPDRSLELTIPLPPPQQPASTTHTLTHTSKTRMYILGLSANVRARAMGKVGPKFGVVNIYHFGRASVINYFPDKRTTRSCERACSLSKVCCVFFSGALVHNPHSIERHTHTEHILVPPFARDILNY